jgi:hypothetical protein
MVAPSLRPYGVNGQPIGFDVEFSSHKTQRGFVELSEVFWHKAKKP